MPVEQEYNVPKIQPIQLLSASKQLVLGRIYGIGISQAVASEAIRAGNSTDGNYDISGSVTVEYEPDARPNSRILGAYEKTSAWDGYMSSSLIGMPVLSYLKIIGGTYLDLQGRRFTIPSVTFETCLMSLQLGKNINISTINGRDTGSIKEYIGLGDWTIDIRAVISSDSPVNSSVRKKHSDGVFPRDNMSEIWKVLRCPISLPVDSWFLNQFDIYYITIMDGATIEQVEGEYSYPRIVIPALSDNPLIIKIAQ